MNNPKPPAPPPMREYQTKYGCDVRVNEYKDVDWYTERGEVFDESSLSTRLPKTWLGRLFMIEDQKRLEKSLMINREMCREWPRK
jgi:hypothetical protein